MKKLLSLLLAAMMIISVLPTAALADGMKTLDMAPVGEVTSLAEQPAEQEQPTEEPAAEENEAPVLRAPAAVGTVKVYATVAGITFKNANGEAVSAAEEASGEYIAYVIDNASGFYTYSAEGYGTGAIKTSGGDEIYLRVVDYALKEAGGSTFKMRVVNTKDSELVYTSEESEQSAKLLIPALGYNVCYRAHFEPTDDEYVPFEMNLWVLKGAEQFNAFKGNSFNLSDSGKYTMGKKAKVTFNVPQGAKLKVQRLVKFYWPISEYPTTFVETKDGYDVYEAYVSVESDATLQYEVTKEGFAKKADIFKANAGTVTVESLKENSSVLTNVGHPDENSIITNINARKFLELEVGEAKDLWFSRAWQAIDTITTNQYVNPENHFYILEGDSVKIDEYGVVTGVKKGVSVIAMTYDALEYYNQSYKAVDPDKIAVFVVSVGGSSEGIDNGIDISDLETFYIVSSLKIDGVGEVKANSSYKYTFTPKAASGEEIKVAVANVYGYPTPTMSAWKEYSRNSDGSFTVELTKGRNIVRIKAGSAEDYYVLNASETNVTIENVTDPGNKIESGETVRISYTNLITPEPKLGAVYNPGYPDTVYMIGEAKSSDPNAESIALEGPHTQYGISQSSSSLFEFEVKSEGKITISDVKIHLMAYGSGITHYTLGIQSEYGNYNGGLSPEGGGLYCFFQDVEFDCGKHEHRFTKEVTDEKYLAAPATETEATYYKSCVCGEKGTETFTVNYLLIKTGSKAPTATLGCALETIKLIGSGMKLLPGYTETEYTIELPADTDKTKPITIEMKGLISKIFYGKPICKDRFFWAETENQQIQSKSLYDISADCKKPGQITILPEWNADGEAIIEVGLSTKNGLHLNPKVAKFIKVYKLNLKIHKHSFVNEIVDEKYLAAAADCENAALYYKSCDCGAHGEETFAYGEKLGHDLSKMTWNTKEHWKKCLRCGKLLELEGHIYTDWAEGVDGKEHHHCTVCGFEQTATTIHIGGSGSKAPLSEQNPNTGAPAMSMAPAVLVLAAAVLVLKKRG